MLNGIIDRRERTLSVRTQPPRITSIINLLTINLMVKIRKNKNIKNRIKEEMMSGCFNLN